MKTVSKNLTFKERIKAPTPSLFRKIRNVGIILGSIGTGILTIPVTMPAILITIAGYLLTAGVVATAISSTTVDEKKLKLSNK
jgi:ABC-type xylose transport system permease subunit